jgi:heme exporter protein C
MKRHGLTITGAVAAVTLVMTAVLGIVITPPDVTQKEYARFLYLHPPMAWVAYLAFGVAALSSILYLWPRTRRPFFDHLALAAVESGVLFTGLVLVTGSMWAEPVWGTYWVWDARLTATALMFVMFLGYLALRRMGGTTEQIARRAAIVALISSINVPLVHFSVLWWNTLHQGPSVLTPGLSSQGVHGAMAWTMLLSFVAFTCLFVWMVGRRIRLEQLRSGVGNTALNDAIAARLAEGDVVGVSA